MLTQRREIALFTHIPKDPRDMTDRHTLVERLLADAAETEKLVANLERQHGDPADGMIALFANMRRKAADQTEAATRITALEVEKAELVDALGNLYDGMVCLINDSAGVYGLHLNGDPAEWDDLLTGGRFEDWLGQPMDNASATLAKARQTEGEG